MGEVRYLIHTCPKRIWYVREFLIPSMLEQGISDDDILVYNDENRDGQLTSFLKSYDYIKGEDTWHLQDDIIISKNFRKIAEERKEEIVCGFCNSYSTQQPGRNNAYNMWYSMPCIRISDNIFKGFYEWMFKPETRKKFRHYFMENKHDDVFLQFYVRENCPQMVIYNVAPNMVNHIDHLIGGSLINQMRDKNTQEIMSSYWDEPELLEEIEEQLNDYRK